MADIYDKLGDLLNEALEKNEIPQKNNNLSNEQIEFSRTINQTKETAEEKSTFEESNSTENNIFTKDFIKKEEIPVGEVVKMHKYTEILHIPPEISAAMGTLDIAYPFTIEELKKQYRKLLLKYHPDTLKTTIQDTKIVYKLRQLQTEKITNAYELVLEWLNNNCQKK